MPFKKKINSDDSVLLKSQKIQYKTDCEVDFIFSETEQILEDIESEIEELKAELRLGKENKQRITEELGDVFFSLCNLANKCDINAEYALEYSNTEFQRRFNFIREKLCEENIVLKDAGFDKLLELWKMAKLAK